MCFVDGGITVVLVEAYVLCAVELIKTGDAWGEDVQGKARQGQRLGKFDVASVRQSDPIGLVL